MDKPEGRTAVPLLCMTFAILTLVPARHCSEPAALTGMCCADGWPCTGDELHQAGMDCRGTVPHLLCVREPLQPHPPVGLPLGSQENRRNRNAGATGLLL